MTGQVRSRESTGRWRQSDAGLGDPAHARFVEINSPDFRFADLRWSRELLQHSIRDETLINTAQRIHEPPQNALRLDHDLRKLLQGASTSELFRIVDDHLRTMLRCGRRRNGTTPKW